MRTFSRDDLYATVKLAAADRLSKMSDKMLTDAVNELTARIDAESVRCARTIVPRRLFVSVDAMLLLISARDNLGHPLLTPNGDNLPRYKDMVVHPQHFPDCDINPFQFHIYA